MQDLEKIFVEARADLRWTFEASEGKEALQIPCDAAKAAEYDHVIYCSAGNGLWKPTDGPAWKKLMRNIEALDPEMVVVVLLGTADLWARLLKQAGKTEPTNLNFFTEVKAVMQRKGVRFAELTDFMKGLTYKDAIGHVAKNSNRKLASKLMETFAQLASSHKCVGGRARREAPATEAVRCAPGARQPLALGGGGDVLDTEKCLTEDYPGWEDDLHAQHGISRRGSQKSFYCERCETWISSWAQVPEHCKGGRHQSRAATAAAASAPPIHHLPEPPTAAGTEGAYYDWQQPGDVPDNTTGLHTQPATATTSKSSPPVKAGPDVTAVSSEEEPDEWLRLQRYAQAGQHEHIDAELKKGADANARAPGDDRTPLFWAA